MNTATEGKTATRFDVFYDVMEASNSAGEGGSFAMRDGKAYHFRNGVVWEGMGFPFSAGLVKKTGETDGLPCFHWRHQSYTEMVGRINGDVVSIDCSASNAMIYVNDKYIASVPCAIHADGFIWPDDFYDIEHRVVNFLT